MVVGQAAVGIASVHLHHITEKNLLETMMAIMDVEAMNTVAMEMSNIENTKETMGTMENATIGRTSIAAKARTAGEMIVEITSTIAAAGKMTNDESRTVTTDLPTTNP